MHKRSPPADTSAGVCSIEKLSRATFVGQTELFSISESVKAIANIKFVLIHKVFKVFLKRTNVKIRWR